MVQLTDEERAYLKPSAIHVAPTASHRPPVIRVRTRKGGYNRIINRPAPKMPNQGQEPKPENTAAVRSFHTTNGCAVDPLSMY